MEPADILHVFYDVWSDIDHVRVDSPVNGIKLKSIVGLFKGQENLLDLGFAQQKYHLLSVLIITPGGKGGKAETEPQNEEVRE